MSIQKSIYAVLLLSAGYLLPADVQHPKLIATLENGPYYGGIEALEFSPHDDTRLASADFICSLCLWNTEDKTELIRCEDGRSYRRSLAYSPIENLLAKFDFYSYAGSSVEITNGDTMKGVKTIKCSNNPYDRKPTSLAFQPNGHQLAFLREKHLSLWDTKSHEIKETQFTGSLLSYHPEGTHIALAYLDAKFVGNVKTGQQNVAVIDLANSEIVHEKLYEHIPIGPETVELEIETKTPGKKKTMRANLLSLRPARIINALAHSPNGKQLASATREALSVRKNADHSIYIFDCVTGKQVHKLSGHEGDISSIAYSPKDGYLLSGSHDKTVHMWNPENGNQIYSIVCEHPITAVAHNKDDTFAVGDAKGSIYLWKVIRETEKKDED